MVVVVTVTEAVGIPELEGATSSKIKLAMFDRKDPIPVAKHDVTLSPEPQHMFSSAQPVAVRSSFVMTVVNGYQPPYWMTPLSNKIGKVHLGFSH